MLKCLRPGDCVWDVGANIGLYSELFVDTVGPGGKVISFEPSNACVATLEGRRRDRGVDGSWQIVPVALADHDGDAWLSVASGDSAPNNHLASRSDVTTVPVQVARGDSLVARGYDPPQLVKIDVEGFEGEVLDGMDITLGLPSLRAVCLEMHFATLSERGKRYEPTRIIRILQDHAFAVRWTDKSHIIAQR